MLFFASPPTPATAAAPPPPPVLSQALVSELKEELMRLIGSTKKAQKIDKAPGMEVNNKSIAGDCNLTALTRHFIRRQCSLYCTI